MLAEKLHGTDPEDVILDAFKEFDENNTGFIPKVPYFSQNSIKHINDFTTVINGLFSTRPRTVNTWEQFSGIRDHGKLVVKLLTPTILSKQSILSECKSFLELFYFLNAVLRLICKTA